MAENNDITSKEFDLDMVLPAFDEVARSISQAAEATIAKSTTSTQENWNDRTEKPEKPVQEMAQEAPIARPEPPQYPTTSATQSGSETSDWGEQMAALQSEIEKLSAELEKQSEENPLISSKNGNLSNKLEQNQSRDTTPETGTPPLMNEQTMVALANLDQMIDELDQKLAETKPVEQEKPITDASANNPESIQPDFTSNVQNWTDNPFNRDFQVYSGRAETKQTVKSPVKAPETTLTSGKVPVPAEIKTTVEKTTTPAALQASTNAESSVAATEKKSWMSRWQTAPSKLIRETAPISPAEVIQAQAVATAELKTETKSPEKVDLSPALAEKPAAEKETEQKLDKKEETTVDEDTGVELTREEKKIMDRARKNAKKKQHSASYGALVTLVLLLAVVGLSLLAVRVWFGNQEANRHEAEAPKVVETKPVETVTFEQLLTTPSYTISYTLVYDEVNSMVELQHRGESTLTSDRSIGKYYLERSGELYEIDKVDNEATKLTSEPREYEKYLILTPQSLGSLQSTGQETLHGQLYQVQEYENFTGYFADNTLKLVRRNSDDTEYTIRGFEKSVETGFDLLPGETAPANVTTVDEENEDEDTPSASESTQLSTVGIAASGNGNMGDVSVGQYLVFD